jgi:hypothetical protein
MALKRGWRERLPGHGNIFTPHAGSMMIHVHRENGLAHRTVILKSWQVRALRLLMSKWFFVALGVCLVSWSYSVIQAARVPALRQRLATLELDARRLDTLQQTLTQLQTRYNQVRKMLTIPSTADGNTGAKSRAEGTRSAPHP